VEIKSLPGLGTTRPYELRSPALVLPGATTRDGGPEELERVERRLAKHLRGSGVTVIHDLAVPALATTIDHLCIGPGGVTLIEVERSSEARGSPDRTDFADRVAREVDLLAKVLTEAWVAPEQVVGAICRSGARDPRRTISSGGITVAGARGVAKLARRPLAGAEFDVQLAAAVVRNRLGLESARSYRVTRT
jgi:nuclease-like protein